MGPSPEHKINIQQQPPRLAVVGDRVILRSADQDARDALRPAFRHFRSGKAGMKAEQL